MSQKGKRRKKNESGKVSPDIQDGQEPKNLAFLRNT